MTARLRLVLGCVTATALLGGAVFTLIAPTARAASAVLSLSGTVVNRSGEQTVGGVTSLPTNPPPVAGAVIRVDGTQVATSDQAGAFSFDYAGNGTAVTVSKSFSSAGLW